MNKRHYLLFCPALYLLATCGPQPPTTTEGEPFGTISLGADAEQAYNLHSSAKPELCMTAQDDGKLGTGLRFDTCQGRLGQRWARWGKELHGANLSCLVVEQNSDAENAKLVLGKCGPDAAHFAFDADRLRYGQHCVGAAGTGLKRGDAMVLRRCDDAAGSVALVVSDFKSQASAPAAPAVPNAPAVKDNKATAKPKAPAAKAPAVVASGVYGPSPAGTLLAPYFYGWGSPHGFAKTLVDVFQQGGVRAATIAFGLSGDGGCQVTGFEGVKDDIAAFKKLGGVVILSFGGADGTYLQKTCQDPAKLAAAIDGQMALHNTRLIDFDVEGHNLEDKAANNALVDALAIIQKKVSSAVISFTLPVDPDAGLPGNAFELLKLCKQKNVRPSRINLMTMDYGRRPPSGKTAGDFACSAAEATAKQMKSVWPNASDAETFHAIGITPMLGQNDGNQDAPFTVDDARMVSSYAKNRGIGLLAYWAMQRDTAMKGGYNDHSLFQAKDYEYFEALNSKVAGKATDAAVAKPAGPAPVGQTLDLRRWTQEVHAAYAFNNEQQRYQGNGANAAFKSDGSVVITAVKDAQGWSSARLSGDEVGPLPAYYEATITVPTGKGVWPAFWLTARGPWPQGGEIDIMEQINGDGSTHISAHWGPETGRETFSPTEKVDGLDLSRPHRYGGLIAADGVQFYLDGKPIGKKVVFPAESNFPAIASKMVPIVNLAMGGNWPKEIGANTGAQLMVVHSVIRNDRAP